MELGKSVQLQSAALFVQALSVVKLEIMEHSVCDRLLLVVDVSLLQLQSSNLKSDMESILVLESSLIIAGTNSTVQLPRPPQRLARSCSLILRDGRSFFLNDGSSTVSTIKGQRQSYLLFNLFVLMSRFDSADLFLRSTRQLLNVLVTISLNDSIEVYRPPLNRQRLKLISVVYKAAKITKKSGILGLSSWPGENFEGDLLPVTVCVSCAVTLDEYNSKGSNIFWSEAIIYELSFRMNATVKFIQIASPPRLDPTMENKWDDWVNPLTDGSAAIATLQPYSRSRIKAFDYAVPVVSDYVTFITRKPHKANSSNPFYRLMSPLSGLVWLSSIIVIIALLVSMETVFYAHRGRLVGHSRSVKMFVRRHYQGRRRQSVHRFHHSHFVTLTELMKPLIGHGADDPVFYGRLSRDCNAKFQYGTWLLVSIVLGSAYQSQLTSHLVMPDYAVPPGTFGELADSDMSLYAVLWGGNIEADFRSLNTSYSDKLLRDVTELKYFEPDCYVKVFEGESTCIGFHGTFIYLSTIFTVDINGQILFLESKESRFSRSLTYAVSKYYGDLTDKLNFVIRSILNSGVMDRWGDNLLSLNIKTGKEFAHKIKDRLPIYGGHDERDENDSISLLILNIAIVGYSVAALAVLIEILLRRTSYIFKPAATVCPFRK